MAALAEAKAALSERVVGSFDQSPNGRLGSVCKSLVKHLHAFVNEVEPSEKEWMEALNFLTAVGKTCTDVRHEYILLSDVLGVSSLVDIINHGSSDERATEPTVLGPFHVEGSDVMENGASIVRRHLDTDVPARIHGKITDVDGKPIVGAVIDVWETDSNGLYDIQEDTELTGNLRGKFMTDEAGRYSFIAVRPVSYQIPNDGPVGKLLRTTGRHTWRAAHIHAQVTAKGYAQLTTHIFDSICPYLETDTVFGMKHSLIREFREVGDGTVEAEFDIVLMESPEPLDS
jgi:hydroxyquinol 1,2-dioxygenase